MLLPRGVAIVCRSATDAYLEQIRDNAPVQRLVEPEAAVYPACFDEQVAIDVHPNVRPNTPKLLPNVECDGYGILEERRCGCGLEGLGCTLHTRQIRSVGKLTGKGMNFLGNDLVRLLEEELPAALGGGRPTARRSRSRKACTRARASARLRTPWSLHGSPGS